MVGDDGFEPSKQITTDLQSAPFGHFGILPRKALVKPIVVREIITRKESNGASTQNRTENRRLKSTVLPLNYRSI